MDNRHILSKKSTQTFMLLLLLLLSYHYLWCICVPCGSLRTTNLAEYSPNMWVLEIELKLSGFLVTSAFTHGDISRAQCIFLLKQPVMVNVQCQLDRMQNHVGDKLIGMSVRCFLG